MDNSKQSLNRNKKTTKLGVVVVKFALITPLERGRIFTTGLTKMGMHFQVFSIELLERGHKFWG